MLIVPKLNPNTPTLMDGEVRLFKRKHSKVWQIAFTLDGRQVRVSSKKRILNDAVAAAREIYLDYRFRQKNGLPVISKRFADVAALCRTKLSTIPQHQLSITCGLCKHHTMLEVANLIAVVGGDTTAHEVRQRARCHNCGVKGNNTYQHRLSEAPQMLLRMALVFARESHFA